MTTLKDIMKPTCDEVTAGFSDLAIGIRGFGSAFLRDINQPTNDFETIEESIDKKPDLMVVVNSADMNKCIDRVCEKLDIQDTDKFREVARSNAEHAPVYAHVKTEDRHNIEIGKVVLTHQIPYRITLATTTHLAQTGSDAYALLRMSKPTTEIYRGSSYERLNISLNKAYNHICSQAVQLLPKTFTGEQLLRKYCQYTYLMEIYRLNDVLFSRKANQIYEGKVVSDFFTGSVEDVKDVLARQVRPYLERHVSEHVEPEFIEQRFTKTSAGSGVYKDIFLGNVKAFRTTIRNAKLHKAAGQSRREYVTRKAKTLVTPSS